MGWLCVQDPGTIYSRFGTRMLSLQSLHDVFKMDFSEISISTVKERGRSASSVILSFLTSSSFESFIRNC